MDNRSLLLNPSGSKETSHAFASLVEAHASMVTATARRLAGEDADDVTQAVFILLWRKSESLKNHRNLAGWLHETTRLVAANARRRRRRDHERLVAFRNQQKLTAPPGSETSAASNLIGHLDEGFSRLPNSYRQVLLMRYMQELSVEETARRLTLSPAAVLKRSTRGLGKLREFFNRLGISVPTNALPSAMAVTPLTNKQRNALTAIATTASPGAVALADSTSRHLQWMKFTTVATAAAVALVMTTAVVLAVLPDQHSSSPPAAATTPAVAAVAPAPAAAPATVPVAPPLDPPTTGSPRETADRFLKALADGDDEELARYLPPGDDAQSRALASKDVDDILNQHYSHFPQRLAVAGGTTMVANDAAHHVLSGVFDVPSPIDAMTEHLTLTVETIHGHWYVTQALYGDSNAFLQTASQTDLPAKAAQDHFDYAKACNLWTSMNQHMRDIGDPTALKPEDVPRVHQAMQDFKKSIQQVADALQGSRLRLEPEDIDILSREVDRMDHALSDGGAAGMKKEAALCQLNTQLIGANQRIMNTGNSLQAIVDAQQELHHTDRRPVSVEADRVFTGMDDSITVPGPLKFPEWLRQTNAFKLWMLQHDIRTFTTRDDAGNYYLVSASGALQTADGKLHEIISQIRMYRPDKTFAAETNFAMAGEIDDWKTVDASGKRLLWYIVQSMHEGDHFSVDHVIQYQPDGSQRWYNVHHGKISLESTADPIGGNFRTVTDPDGHPTHF